MNIKRKLIALLLSIGLVPTLAVSVIAYIAISNGLRDNTSNQLVSTSIKQEQRVNGLLQNKQEEVVKLANKYDFQIALGQYLATTKKADQESIESVIRTKKIEVPDIQTISVANLDGTIVASTLTGADGQKVASKVEGVSVKEDPRDGIIKLYITTKVSVNKKESAIMSVVFRTDDIVAAVQDYTGLGATGETVVVGLDSNKKAISLFPLRFDTDAALKVSLTSLEPFDRSGNAYTRDKDYRGNEVMVVSRSVGFADWVIVTKIDTAEALAAIVQLRNILMTIGIFSSIAIILIGVYIARFFTEPILRIARVSKLIGTGDFSAHLEMQRKDEFGALATSINSMGSSLKEFVSSIESQRNRLEVILNSTEESILALDPDGVILIANRATAELTGQSVAKIVGRPMQEVFNWTRDGQNFFIEYNAPGIYTYRDLEHTDPSGAMHYAELIVARVGDHEHAAQTIVTIHDQTKSRELENMKLDFVSMAAHELRTPLATIRGYLELISYKVSKNIEGDNDAYIRQALQSTSDLGGLITNLLDVTRIERDALTLSLEKVDLAATLEQAVKDVTFSANDKQIGLLYKGPSQDNFVAADPIALREVINNLLTNAVKYTLSGGNIEVTLGDLDESGHYNVAFKDTGIGIPKQAMPNLFTKFYRVDGGLNSSSGGGTGLGLFITKSIVERHGGTIRVESEEGVGSTFTLTIPAFDEQKFAEIQKKQQINIDDTRNNHGWTTKNTDR